MYILLYGGDTCDHKKYHCKFIVVNLWTNLLKHDYYWHETKQKTEHIHMKAKNAWHGKKQYVTYHSFFVNIKSFQLFNSCVLHHCCVYLR